MPILTPTATNRRPRSNRALSVTIGGLCSLVLCGLVLCQFVPLDVGITHGVYLGRYCGRRPRAFCDFSGMVMMLRPPRFGIASGDVPEVCTGKSIHCALLGAAGVCWELDWW